MVQGDLTRERVGAVDGVDDRADLALEHLLGLAGLALGLELADACDHAEPAVERGNGTTVSGVLVHQNMETCELEWSDGDVGESSLNLPFDEDGRFDLGFSDIQENLTISVRGTCGAWVDSLETEVFNITVTCLLYTSDAADE